MAIQGAQAAIAWAEHLVLIYPLWLGTLPALFKAFLEQALRHRSDSGNHRRQRRDHGAAPRDAAGSSGSERLGRAGG